MVSKKGAQDTEETHHSTTGHSCRWNVCKTGRFKDNSYPWAESLALTRLKAKHLQQISEGGDDVCSTLMMPVMMMATWFWSSRVLKFSTQSMSRGPSKTSRRWQSFGQEENSLDNSFIVFATVWMKIKPEAARDETIFPSGVWRSRLAK